MTIPIDNLDPVELSLVARASQAEFDAAVTSLSRFLPNQTVNDIRYTYSRGVDALVDEASFRAFDAESGIGRRPGSAKVSGELLPISRKVPLSEYDQLRIRNAPNDEVVDGVFADAARLARGIAARFERARGELLTTGSVALAENGLVTTYASGRHASLTVGALGTLWSNHAAATPIANVQAWQDLQDAQGAAVGNVLSISRAAMIHLQQCDDVKNALYSSSLAPDRITPGQVADAFAAFAGVRIEVRDSVPGMSTQPVASNIALLVSDQVTLGATLLGTPLEALEPEYSALAPQPGVVAGAWKEKDPIAVWTHAVAIGLPILSTPDSTLSAQVIA